MPNIIALVICVVGLLAHALATNPKASRIGLIAYAVGLLVVLLHLGPGWRP